MKKKLPKDGALPIKTKTVMVSLRIPVATREKINVNMKALKKKTGIALTESQYIRAVLEFNDLTTWQ